MDLKPLSNKAYQSPHITKGRSTDRLQKRKDIALITDMQKLPVHSRQTSHMVQSAVNQKSIRDILMKFTTP